MYIVTIMLIGDGKVRYIYNKQATFGGCLETFFRRVGCLATLTYEVGVW